MGYMSGIDDLHVWVECMTPIAQQGWELATAHNETNGEDFLNGWYSPN
jgi:hypothetical protein